MSSLSDLLGQVRAANPDLAANLEREIKNRTRRQRQFGLVFEEHRPEAVELPSRPVRKGDKVRVLSPRGEIKQGDQTLWRVQRIARADDTAHLVEVDGEREAEAAIEDLVVVAEFRDHMYPGLVETGRVENGGDKPFHTVINAENFHALEMLTYTHRHKVDCIYIDPPYNNGARDWKYNNDYVARDDDYRHSKWLSFMERRLQVAQELLNPEDSVLVVTIDEKEVHRLGLLLRQCFPQARIQMISSVINPTGAIRVNEFTRTNEFIFVVLIGTAKIGTEEAQSGKNESVRWNSLRRFEMPSRRGGPQPGPDQFYPIYVDKMTHRIVGVGDPLPLGVPRSAAPEREGCATEFPLKPDGTEMTWGLTGPTLLQRVAEGYARATPGRAGGYTIYYLTSGKLDDIANGEIVVTGTAADGSVIVERPTGVRTVMPTTHWTRESHNAQSYGTKLLKKFLGNRPFPFPKSLFAVEDVLRMFIADKPNATILDFFAGSGTTAHAVMRLNKQDGGRRQCISVTNNEVSADEQRGLRKKGLRPGDPEWEQWGICDYVTKPRVTAAITGRTPEGAPIKGDYKFTDEFPMADGFEENAAFFTLTYEAPLMVRQDLAFERIAPLLWMRAGSRGRVITKVPAQGWDVAEAYGVLTKVDRAAPFAEAVAEAGVGTVYVVTDDERRYQAVCALLPEDVTPVRLYESYLTNFEINTGGRTGA